jgi:hypothetical protein
LQLQSQRRHGVWHYLEQNPRALFLPFFAMANGQYEIKATVRHLERVGLCVISSWFPLRASLLRRAVS